ncbi:hypothetical protein [Pontibacter akesuensis]|uniref:Uncharacterized protein n=1 Tax=Pontibacter akesuensis TaxID=388950 RepID=A0A1I7K712_9BACT|nr:hypothetical protein [Pontibacter akesuensis]GHA74611.1 hypothetical protein GCM10007389_30460 [Pontibacter akesuensis]SFU93191.1 hypothetical protein SAMN04487941_3460 [Pontibacter akesuensis]
MERYNRDRYDNSGYRQDNRYDRERDGRSYRDMQDQFERDYQRNNTYRQEGSGDRYSQNRGYNDDRDRSYGGNYRRDENGFGRYSNNFSQDRDRYSSTSYQSDFRNDPTYYRRDSDNYRGDNDLRGNIRQGYGISSFDGTSDRFNTLDSEHNRGGAGDEQAYYSGARDGYRSTRLGGGVGDAFPGSHHGVPDTNYGLSNFADDYGSGIGSSYGGKNYGGGTGYASGHRGGSFGNHTYGTSAGNYGGYGSMGSSTYGGRSSSTGDTSHNSDRGVSEFGGF